MKQPIEELKRQVFKAKETRAAEQRRLIREFRMPLISFTLILPGGYFQYSKWPEVWKLACASLDDAFPESFYSQNRLGEWGPEAFYAIDLEASTIKQTTCRLEDETPLSRLYDMDVIDLSGIPVSRTSLGAAPRQCLICDQPAVECYVTRRHSLESLVEEVKSRMDHGIQQSVQQNAVRLSLE